MSESIKGSIWVGHIINDIKSIHPKIEMLCANQAAIIFDRHEGCPSKAKRIAQRYNHLRDLVEIRNINIKCIESKKTLQLYIRELPKE